MSQKKKQGVGQNKNFGKSQVRFKPLGDLVSPLQWSQPLQSEE